MLLNLQGDFQTALPESLSFHCTVTINLLNIYYTPGAVVLHKLSHFIFSISYKKGYWLHSWDEKIKAWKAQLFTRKSEWCIQNQNPRILTLKFIFLTITFYYKSIIIFNLSFFYKSEKYLLNQIDFIIPGVIYKLNCLLYQLPTFSHTVLAPQILLNFTPHFSQWKFVSIDLFSQQK